MVDDLGLPWEAEEESLVDTSRWSIVKEIIFKHDNKFYMTWVEQGATEYQETQPWEGEEEVECVEVEKREVLVKEWVPVENG